MARATAGRRGASTHPLNLRPQPVRRMLRCFHSWGRGSAGGSSVPSKNLLSQMQDMLRDTRESRLHLRLSFRVSLLSVLPPLVQHPGLANQLMRGNSKLQRKVLHLRLQDFSLSRLLFQLRLGSPGSLLKLVSRYLQARHLLLLTGQSLLQSNNFLLQEIRLVFGAPGKILSTERLVPGLQIRSGLAAPVEGLGRRPTSGIASVLSRAVARDVWRIRKACDMPPLQWGQPRSDHFCPSVILISRSRQPGRFHVRHP
mmetsp:Transcript_2127/g.4244  ORF Transcript_2127/g.4244 Transcript_2127/m.4244 type:complete len:256 (+) Transcript_2127:24-791(+)